MIPTPDITTINGIIVVRDDRLKGGSKRRALTPIMTELRNDGYTEFVFGGPAEGYAQLALAYSAQDTGTKATYFVAARKEPHPNTTEALKAGITIHQCRPGYLTVIQSRAKAYAANTPGAYFFPLGFGTERYEQILTETIKTTLKDHNLNPTQTWCVAGSGVLSRCLANALPNADHHAIQIGFNPTLAPGTTLHHAPERFGQRSRNPPPFPSSPWYDAKAWQFISTRAEPGALFWNVGA